MYRKLITAPGVLVVSLLAISLSWAAAPTTRPATRSPAEAQAYLDRDITVHVLTRCAFGPKPGQIVRVYEKGWKKWIEEQLQPEKIKDDALEKKLVEQWPSLRMDLVQMWHTYSPSYDDMMMTGPGAGAGGGAGGEMTEEQRRELQRKRNQLRYKIERELRDSVVLRAVESERQLNEVVVEFWRNHLFVDNLKDELVYLANNYEETVIRANAFGKFENMLLASASHPAMLIYLDNVISQRPLTAEEEKRIARWNPSQGNKPRRVAALERHPGLNENYARELLELHTFGADNGYTQADVYELARVLTGWSVDKSRDRYGFYFRDDYHDKLQKQVVGMRLRGGNNGVDEGVAVIRALARHPNTANFISWKLCRYFVNDEPPMALVKKVASTFRATGGDLRRVYKEILLSPEFVNRDHFKSKFKTPFEFVVSSIRAAGATVEDTSAIHGYLARMGQPIYACDDPTGYYDQAEAWCDPGVLVHRWDFAIKLASNRLKGITVPESFFQPLVDLEPEEIKDRLVANITPNGIDEKTSQALTDYAERSMGGMGGVTRMFGLLLGSPAFQQQ